MQQRSTARQSGASSLSRLSNCFSPESNATKSAAGFYSTLALSSTPHFAVSTRHSVTSRIQRNSRAFCYLIFSTRHLNATLEKHKNVEKFTTSPSLFCRFRLARQTPTSHRAAIFRAAFLDASAPDLLGSPFALLRESFQLLRRQTPARAFQESRGSICRAIRLGQRVSRLPRSGHACEDVCCSRGCGHRRAGRVCVAEQWLWFGPTGGRFSPDMPGALERERRAVQHPKPSSRARHPWRGAQVWRNEIAQLPDARCQWPFASREEQPGTREVCCLRTSAGRTRNQRRSRSLGHACRGIYRRRGPAHRGSQPLCWPRAHQSRSTRE